MKVSKLIRELERLDPDTEVRNYWTGTKLRSIILGEIKTTKKKGAKVFLFFEWL